MINELSSSDNSADDDINDSRQPALNDLEQLVAIGPDVVAPDTEGEEPSSAWEEEEKESGLEISEPSPPPSSNGLEKAQDQQQAFDDYLKNWGAKLNAQMEENEMKASAYTENNPR